MKLELNSTQIIGDVHGRYKELSDYNFDWKSFYNGWIEGRVKLSIGAEIDEYIQAYANQQTQSKDEEIAKLKEMVGAKIVSFSGSIKDEHKAQSDLIDEMREALQAAFTAPGFLMLPDNVFHQVAAAISKSINQSKSIKP